MFTCLTSGTVVSLVREVLDVPVPEPGVKAWVLNSPEDRILSRKTDALQIMVNLAVNNNDKDVSFGVIGWGILRIHASCRRGVLEQMIKNKVFDRTDE